MLSLDAGMTWMNKSDWMRRAQRERSARYRLARGPCAYPLPTLSQSTVGWRALGMGRSRRRRAARLDACHICTKRWTGQRRGFDV